MADITLSSNSILRPYRASVGSPEIRHIQGSTFAAGSSIILGDVVQSDTAVDSNASRLVRMANAVPSTAIYGVAAGNDPQDGTTGGAGLGAATTQRIPVWLANPDTEFIAVTKVAGIGSSSVGKAAALKRDSTLAIWYVDTVNSTAGDARVRIIGVPNPGDTNGQVIFRFMSTALVLRD